MNLSRKWLDEFVTVQAGDKEFDEAMIWGRRSAAWWWAAFWR